MCCVLFYFMLVLFCFICEKCYIHKIYLFTYLLAQMHTWSLPQDREVLLIYVFHPLLKSNFHLQKHAFFFLLLGFCLKYLCSFMRLKKMTPMPKHQKLLFAERPLDGNHFLNFPTFQIYSSKNHVCCLLQKYVFSALCSCFGSCAKGNFFFFRLLKPFVVYDYGH